MQLSIKNLGPIKEGLVDLAKPLTILTGPNNTGKSYLTYLIYGISQYRELDNYSITVERLSNLHTNLDYFKKKRLTKNSKIDIYKTILGKDIAISEIITEIVKNNFTKIFASSTVTPSISIGIINTAEYAYNGHYKYLQTEGENIIGIGQDGSTIESKTLDNVNLRFSNPKERILHLLGIITSLCINNQVSIKSYFFPAERTAINLFAKHITSTKAEIKDELDTEVISVMSDEALGRRLRARVKAAPKYPYAIRDYINFVNNFKPNEEGEFAPIAFKIEAILTGGSVTLDEFDQLTFVPKGLNSSLELHLSSSLVKSLSYLILYLRYTAEYGDQVIIDEPELNLHPNLQVAFARIIAEMVNAGLKVIISTHSDYLIKELNNLILLSKLPASEENITFLAEHNYQPEHLLASKQVSAYFLSDHTITEINVEENGIEVPSINDAILAIDSMAQEIYFRLEE